MQILQTNQFKKLVKKLPPAAKKILDKVIRDVITNPKIGEAKVGDLQDVFVYKFRLNNQLTLLAYTYNSSALTLLSFGPHENFYRDLKKNWH